MKITNSIFSFLWQKSAMQIDDDTVNWKYSNATKIEVLYLSRTINMNNTQHGTNTTRFVNVKAIFETGTRESQEQI